MRPKFTPAVRKKSTSTSASTATEGGASSSSTQPARKKPVNPDEAINFFNRAADVYRDIASVAEDGGRRKKGAEDGDGDGEGGGVSGRKKRKSEGGALSEEEGENGEDGSLTDKKKEHNGEEDDEDINTVRKKLRAVRAQRRCVAASISPLPRAQSWGNRT